MSKIDKVMVNVGNYPNPVYEVDEVLTQPMTVKMLRDELANYPDDMLMITVSGDAERGFVKHIEEQEAAFQYTGHMGGDAEVESDYDKEKHKRPEGYLHPVLFLSPYHFWHDKEDEDEE